MLKKRVSRLFVFLSLSLLTPLYAQEATSSSQQKPEGVYDQLALHLVEYEAFDKEGKPLELIRIGKENDGGYVVPVQALNKSEALFGYGIGDDISFEDDYCRVTQKPAYAFDGGVSSIAVSNPLCSFYSECIATDKFLNAAQTSSGKCSTFSEQLTRFGLKESPVFIKMDIEGAEYVCFEDILTHAQQVTGFVVEIHYLTTPDYRIKAESLLSSVEKDFVLIHLHANNHARYSNFESQYVKGQIPFVVELTYINKNLLSTYKISSNQKHPKAIDLPNEKYGADCYFEILPPGYLR